MTTLEPGASDVLTHGLRSSPRATALRASSPAPSMTEGFDVFVQLVIAAMTTSPWPTSVCVPSSSVTGTTVRSRSATAACSCARRGSAAWSRAPSPLEGSVALGGSEAGKDMVEPGSGSGAAFGRSPPPSGR